MANAMTMALAPARLSRAELTVEIGSTAETTVVLAAAEATPAGVQEFTVRLRGLSDESNRPGERNGHVTHVHERGLPEGWYTLSAEHVSVPAGERAQVLLVIHPPQDSRTESLGEYLFLVEVSVLPDGETFRLPARLVSLPRGGVSKRSRLLDYLPGLYREDPFLGRFLLVFQSIIDPIQETIDSTHHYLDPAVAPPGFLPWLASWVGLTLDAELDEEHQRELIRKAVELSRWKGTRRGLRESLRLLTNGRALIVENFDGMRLGQDACLGLNTHLGARRDHSITVTLAMDNGKAPDQRRIGALVDELKPAHVGHVVRLVPAPGLVTGGTHG